MESDLLTVKIVDTFMMEKKWSRAWTNRSELDYKMHFQNFLADAPKTLPEITHLFLLEHLNKVGQGKTGKPSPHMALGEYRVLKVFFNWCVEKDYLSKSPLNFKMGKPTDRVKPVPTRNDLRNLLAYMDDGTFTGIRNRAILLFMAGSGARISEVLMDSFNERTGLREDDVDFQQRICVLYGKGKRERIVPMNQNTAKAMWEYKTEVRRRFPAKKTDAFWVTETGEPLSVSAFQTKLKRIGKQLGIYFSPHTWRKFFITSALEAGMSDTAVMALSGHKTHAMLQHYSKTYQVRKAIAELEKHSPVEGL